MFEKIVYGAMTVGFGAICAGTAIIIQYEGRLSKVETQMNFAFGATATEGTQSKADAADPEGKPSAIPDASRAELALALASSCAKLIETYNSIVGGTTVLFPSDKERLDALASQLTKLGCAEALTSAQPAN